MHNAGPFRQGGTPWKAIFSVLMALVYGASPIDLVPDLIPLLGLVDDALIVPLLLAVAFFQYRKSQPSRPQKVTIIPPRR